MVIRSTIAGVAGIVMMVAAGTTPATAQGACLAGCDGATNWNGFWLGAGIGVNADMIGHEYSTATVAAPTVVTGTGFDESRGADGFFGTVGLGYDWQVRDRFVLGAFTDFDFGISEHKEADYFGTAGPYGWDMERNSTWTIGARVGLLTSNTSMLYGLVGYSRTSYDIAVTEDDGAGNAFTIGRDIDFSGFVVGAGLEQNLGNGFSLKGEYRYTNYGEESFGGAITNLAGTDLETDSFDLDSHSFRLTLAYKFARGGNVVEEVSYKDMAPAPYK
ncbi:MAG: porin family protein [bacterium]|nr:porin family protein [bacterium]